MNPTARRADVIVQDIGTDTFVYDRRSDRAHSLTGVAGYVYRHADGTRTVDEITEGMSTALAAEADPLLTEAALWQLGEADLLEVPVAEVAGRTGLTRREAMRRFGAAVAIAAVSSIVAPSPAMARSGGGLGKGPKGPKDPKGPKKDKKDKKGKSSKPPKSYKAPKKSPKKSPWS